MNYKYDSDELKFIAGFLEYLDGSEVDGELFGVAGPIEIQRDGIVVGRVVNGEYGWQFTAQVVDKPLDEA